MTKSEKPGNPRVVLVGTTDVDARIPLMQRLRNRFDISALGSSACLAERFAELTFQYGFYHLSRRANPVADVRTFVDLVTAFRALRPDIVHTFDTKPGVWGRLAARLAGVPIVIGTIPGAGSLYADNRPLTRLLRAVYQPLLRSAALVSDMTVFQNRHDLAEFVGQGLVPFERAMVIPGSGVDTVTYDPAVVVKAEQEQVLRELGIHSGQIVVTLITRVLRSKGIIEFSAAAELVRADFPNLLFLLVGPVDKESRDSLTADEIQQLKRNVTYLGPRSDIRAVLSISHIMVLPSYREGIPRVLLEAASMGLPIITTDTSGCRDVVEHGLNGFLVPPRDINALARAMVTLVKDPALRHQFGTASRRRAVEEFELGLIAQRTAQLYMQLLAGKSMHAAT